MCCVDKCVVALEVCLLVIFSPCLAFRCFSFVRHVHNCCVPSFVHHKVPLVHWLCVQPHAPKDGDARATVSHLGKVIALARDTVVDGSFYDVRHIARGLDLRAAATTLTSFEFGAAQGDNRCQSCSSGCRFCCSGSSRSHCSGGRYSRGRRSSR